MATRKHLKAGSGGEARRDPRGAMRDEDRVQHLPKGSGVADKAARRVAEHGHPARAMGSGRAAAG
ncbi:MAG: hypothetical protein A2V85_03870 [Chloroflexi bacterium RBG_16_72_14]|nr:MAG: hypothetical protein A2V85_03870 [Chloroflexi bacterium RBG_16_72_14]